MKKFIAAFDGLRFCESTLNTAVYLARQCDAHLVGVFLEDFLRRSYGYKEIAAYAGEELDMHMHELNEKDAAERNRSIEIFRQACTAAAIPHSIHRDRNVAYQELLHESIYADLLIISAAETVTRYEEQAPTSFIRDLLNNVQCPVVLAPAVYHPLDKIILLYDGEPSSVHAVRMFSYLFENMKRLDTEVLSVKEEKENVQLPDERLINEFIRQHYPLADAVVLKGDPEEVIVNYLKREKRNPIVVLGAYQRSSFSRLFKPSMADHLLHHLTLPLFVAHNKS
jgi:nucleotide-binding universal stress UspA family protein